MPNVTAYQSQSAGHTPIVSAAPSKTYSVTTPYEGESRGDFQKRYAWDNGSCIGANPGSIFAKIDDFFTGNYTKAGDLYDQWYNEQSAAKKAQADYEYTRLLNQSQYSDLVKSLRDAGLNPYAILTNGGLSAGNMQYSSAEAPMRGKPAKEKSNVLMAIALIASAIIKAVI